jgi:Flp pilus assembly protein TadD
MARVISLPFPAPVAVALAAALLVSGCAGGQTPFDSLSGETAPKPEVSLANGAAGDAKAYWAAAYAKNPRDEQAAVSFARVLKAEGDKAKALSVLQQATIYNSDSRLIASEYGRLALDMGQIDLAEKLISRAEDPRNPDWRLVSAKGAIAAKRGDNKMAREFFEKALELAPNEPSVMNNLALTYALDGDAAKAEGMLRRATAAGGDTSKVRQNLALVLGVQGRFDEAKQVAETDISKDKADANVAYLQKMVKATPVQLAKAPAAAPKAEPAVVKAATPAPAAESGWAGTVTQ